MDDTALSVSEFVALVNQTLEFAYPALTIEGEVSEFRVSKGKWVYFNLQDEHSSVRMFGNVFQLKQPVEDGMKVVVRGAPKLHSKYGFSLNMSSIRPSGEGSIKKAFELLHKKLTAEGLFAEDRKRPIPVRPDRIGLITSAQAAAYSDFIKILNERWGGVEVMHADVQVQGEPAPAQIVRAIEYFSQMSDPVDVVVITRGGGGAEDLMAFSTEEVARAVAGSRIPTIVGVGHEIDVSLADMAADVRATTPTNAAQLVVPDKNEFIAQIDRDLSLIGQRLSSGLSEKVTSLQDQLDSNVALMLQSLQSRIESSEQSLRLVNPENVLKRGYGLVTDSKGSVITDAKKAKAGDELMIRLHKGQLSAEVTDAK